MLVKELIQWLQAQPQDAEVWAMESAQWDQGLVVLELLDCSLDADGRRVILSP